MADLYAGVVRELRTGKFYLRENMPGFYSTTRDEARRLILKDGLCGTVDVELEAAHLAIITLAAIPATEHNLPVRPKPLWSLYPLFLPDGRQEEPGWDKTGHFFNHAFLTFESLYMKDRQMPYLKSFVQVHSAIRPSGQDLYPTISGVPVGGPPLANPFNPPHPIDMLNTYYNLFSGSLYTRDITPLDAGSSGDLSLDDWYVYMMSRDIGLFYELFSTPYPIRPNQDIHYWVIQQGHEFNRDIIMQGLFDPGLFNDIAANKLGAKFGIKAYHNPTALPPRSMPLQ
jgi:hypothetical protein